MRLREIHQEFTRENAFYNAKNIAYHATIDSLRHFAYNQVTSILTYHIPTTNKCLSVSIDHEEGIPEEIIRCRLEDLMVHEYMSKWDVDNNKLIKFYNALSKL